MMQNHLDAGYVILPDDMVAEVLLVHSAEFAERYSPQNIFIFSACGYYRGAG